MAIARGLDDPATLASCLLAQHDVLWTPGTGARRAAIATEIAAAARQAGDHERHAQALLLSANAYLESGSAAFRAAFTEFAYVTERLRQPRHDYVLRTRQAALAMLDGDLAAGERLSAEAATLGESVGDTDTGNVRMSQRLELVRARADPEELRRHRGRGGALVGRRSGTRARGRRRFPGPGRRSAGGAARGRHGAGAAGLACRPLVPLVDLRR